MDTVKSIRRLGFRKWYERQLIDCHASLVTCLLCGLVLAALLEEIALLDFASKPAAALTAFGSIVLGWFAWRRYITVLERAERYGQRSTCEGCSAYGRFEVIESGFDAIPGPAAQAVAPLPVAWMNVKCRKCGATWRMPE
jgi:hypothetical protein